MYLPFREEREDWLIMWPWFYVSKTISPVLHTYFPDSLDFHLTSEVHNKRCGLPSPTPTQKALYSISLDIQIVLNSQLSLWPRLGKLSLSSSWSVLLQTTLEIWRGPKGQSLGVRASFSDKRCGLWMSQLQGQAQGRKGVPLFGRVVSHYEDRLYRGVDIMIGKKPGPVEGSLKKIHVSEELRISWRKGMGWGGRPLAWSGPCYLTPWVRGWCHCPQTPKPSKDSCSGGFFLAMRGGPMGGAFLYKAETLWGQGSTMIHFYRKPLQKPLCLTQPHRFSTFL